MKKLSKMLAVPAAFVVAFMLFGTPAAPGATVLPDNVGDAACADTGGNCYGGLNQDGSCTCPGWRPSFFGNGCVPMGAECVYMPVFGRLVPICF